jgi:hypothetical protein
MQPFNTGGEENTVIYSKPGPHRRRARQLVLTACGDLPFVARALSKSVAPHRRGVSNPCPVVRRCEIAKLEPGPPTWGSAASEPVEEVAR